MWGKLECRHLVEKITSWIKHTYAYKLSYAIHSFWGSVFILPQSVVKEVNKKYREYLWGSNEVKMKVSLVSWEKVCFPKRQGGSNIKGCGKWHVASDGKLQWQLAMRKESLWMKWVHGICIKAYTIWSHKALADSSSYWRNIIFLKDKMQHWYTQGNLTLQLMGGIQLEADIMI